MSPTELEDLTRRLEERRRELATELERLIEPPAEGSSLGFGKRIGDGTTEAVERISSTATARSLTASINDIDTAMASIRAGTYGTCEVCGDPIPRARLEALPATTRCIDCVAPLQ